MTAIQICALISLITAAAILYWAGYRGGVTDGKNDGYDEGYSDGYILGRDEASAAYAASIKEISDHVGVGLGQVEALAGGGEDPVHAASPLSSKRSISAAMFSALSRRASA